MKSTLEKNTLIKVPFIRELAKTKSRFDKSNTRCTFVQENTLNVPEICSEQFESTYKKKCLDLKTRLLPSKQINDPYDKERRGWMNVNNIASFCDLLKSDVELPTIMVSHGNFIRSFRSHCQKETSVGITSKYIFYGIPKCVNKKLVEADEKSANGNHAAVDIDVLENQLFPIWNTLNEDTLEKTAYFDRCKKSEKADKLFGGNGAILKVTVEEEQDKVYYLVRHLYSWANHEQEEKSPWRYITRDSILHKSACSADIGIGLWNRLLQDWVEWCECPLNDSMGAFRDVKQFKTQLDTCRDTQTMGVSTLRRTWETAALLLLDYPDCPLFRQQVFKIEKLSFCPLLSLVAADSSSRSVQA